MTRQPCVYILASGHYGTPAISREKQLKRWHRDWKIALIERDNPARRDLAIELGFAPLAPRAKIDGP